MGQVKNELVDRCLYDTSSHFIFSGGASIASRSLTFSLPMFQIFKHNRFDVYKISRVEGKEKEHSGEDSDLG